MNKFFDILNLFVAVMVAVVAIGSVICGANVFLMAVCLLFSVLCSLPSINNLFFKGK